MYAKNDKTSMQFNMWLFIFMSGHGQQENLSISRTADISQLHLVAESWHVSLRQKSLKTVVIQNLGDFQIQM